MKIEDIWSDIESASHKSHIQKSTYAKKPEEYSDRDIKKICELCGINNQADIAAILDFSSYEKKINRKEMILLTEEELVYNDSSTKISPIHVQYSDIKGARVDEIDDQYFDFHVSLEMRNDNPIIIHVGGLKALFVRYLIMNLLYSQYYLNEIFGRPEYQPSEDIKVVFDEADKYTDNELFERVLYAAKKGYHVAIEDLGDIFYDGDFGVPKNYKNAQVCYCEAAKEGTALTAKSQFWSFYNAAYNLKIDITEDSELFSNLKLAAHNGYYEALERLSLIYAFGGEKIHKTVVVVLNPESGYWLDYFDGEPAVNIKIQVSHSKAEYYGRKWLRLLEDIRLSYIGTEMYYAEQRPTYILNIKTKDSLEKVFDKKMEFEDRWYYEIPDPDKKVRTIRFGIAVFIAFFGFVALFSARSPFSYIFSIVCSFVSRKISIVPGTIALVLDAVIPIILVIGYFTLKAMVLRGLS